MSQSEPTESEKAPVYTLGELIFVVVLTVAMAPFVVTTAFIDDEMITLNNGLRQLGGEVLYRDFFEFTGPLSHWMAAALFTVTGPSFLAARLLLAGLLVWSAWLLYRLAIQLGVGRWAAALPGVILIFALFRIWPGYSHHWVALPWLLGAVLAAGRGLREGSVRWWLMAGGATGLGTLTIQSDGLVMLIALSGVTLLDAALGGRTMRTTLRRLAAVVGGWLLPIGVAAVYFGANGAIVEAWYHTWIFPLTQYKSAGGVNDFKFGADLPAVVSPVTNFPWWYGRLYYFLCLYVLQPLVAVGTLAWGLGLLGRRLREGRHWTSGEALWALLGLLSLGFLALSTRGRADYIHVAQYSVFAALLAVAVAARWGHAMSGENNPVGWVPWGLLLGFALTGGLLYTNSALKPMLQRGVIDPDRTLASSPIIQYLRTHTKPSDRILAMPYGGFYYFYGRRAASRFTLVLPRESGYYSDAQIEAIKREIAVNRPTLVVINPWTRDPADVAAYVALLPPGYRQVERIPTPEYGGSVAVIFRASQK